MDDQLRHILQHLYDEDPPVPVEELLRDEDLRAEYESMRAVKAHLDQRPPRRPSAETVDHVVAAASAASRPSGVRARRERRPQKRAFFQRRAVQALAVTLVFLVSMGVLFTQIDGGWSSGDQEETMADQAPRSMDEQKASSGAAPPAASRTAAASADASAPEEAEVDPESPFKARVGLAASQPPPDAPAWDESEAVQRLHRRIELLEARSPETAWDDPAVMSLDVLPGTTAPSRLDRGLNTVRERRAPTGGQ